MCSSFFLLLHVTKNLGQKVYSSCLRTLNSNAWEEKQDCKSNTPAASTPACPNRHSTDSSCTQEDTPRRKSSQEQEGGSYKREGGGGGLGGTKLFLYFPPHSSSTRVSLLKCKLGNGQADHENLWGEFFCFRGTVIQIEGIYCGFLSSFPPAWPQGEP